ncbi:MAG TPA: hypothetical protein VGV35_01305 [Bryobacteraceae bacterium]|nr:hypothetical protein [Bryobacteraceae bacterium]
MPVQFFRKIKEAISNLDPEEIRRHTTRPLRLFLYADSEDALRQMEDFFVPGTLSAARQAQLQHVIYRASEGFLPSGDHDLEIYYEDSPHSVLTPTSQVFAFRPGDPMQTIHEVLRHRPDLAVPLALYIFPFRQEVSKRIVKKVAKENALFALATAIPDIVPLLSLPWAIGEFASDTAILTANQIRMAFLLAAANDREVGYREQKGEVVSIMLGAFGWRALARELVGKIPMGGGLIPKAAIAYAGTRVAGMSLERYYRIGAQYTREERRLAYEDAFERGKKLAASLVNGFKNKAPVASIQEPE